MRSAGRQPTGRQARRRRGGGAPSAVVAALAAFFGLALCGCAASGNSGPNQPRGELLKVDAPLGALAWNATDEFLFGIEDGAGRVVKVDPENLTGLEFDGRRPDAVSASEELNAGENLALDPRRPGEVYVPQPDPGQVRVVRDDDLDDVAQAFDVGVAPQRVALDRLSDTLFALSQDGSTVTRVELSGNEVTAERELDAGPATRIETPGDGSGALWAAGPGGVALFGGPSLEPLGRLSSGAAGLAADSSNPERAYLSRPAEGRVAAVEPGAGGRLEVADEAEVGAGARHLAVEEDRLYVTTPDSVVVLDAADLEILETIDLGPFREDGPLRRVEPSALAVGEGRIYVALAGEPYVLALEKP